MKTKLRRLGDITADMELLIDEMIIDHDLQRGEVISLINGFIESHYPDSIERYEEDDSRSIVFVGHRSNLK